MSTFYIAKGRYNTQMKFSKLSKEADMSNIIQCDDMGLDILIRKLPDEIVDKKAFMLKERSICYFI